LVHDTIAGNERAIAHFDPSREKGAAGDNRRVADAAVVSGMRILHEKIFVADDGDVAMFTPSMNRDTLAKNVATADAHAARLTAIGKILRLVPDYDVGMEHILVAQIGITQNCDVSD